MTWPTATVSKANCDEGTDNPSTWRTDLLDLIDKLNAMIQALGVAGGVCDLGADGKVPLARLKLGSGQGLDADTVDGIHAATTAAANVLLALDASGKLPADITGNAATASDAQTHIARADNPHGVTYAQTGAAASSHTHGQADIQAGAVGQGQLKTASGTVSYGPGSSSSGSQQLTLPGGEYGFYPRSWATGGAWNNHIFDGNAASPATTVVIYATNALGATCYASQRYIQASPPYKIGDINWGHFLFLLRNKSTGEVIAAYEAQDPPWAYNGPMHLYKNDPELLAAIPHPFPEYGSEKFPATDFEVVLVDMRDMDVGLWMYDNLGHPDAPKQTILEDLKNVAPLGAAKTHAEVGIPEIPGWTDKIKIKARI